MSLYQLACANAHARSLGGAVLLVVAALLLTSGCTSIPSAGSLDDPAPSSQLGTNEAKPRSTAGAATTHSGAAAGAADSASNGAAVPDFGPTVEISSQRQRLVAQAVDDFVQTMPTAKLISLHVLSEGAKSSAAAVTVVRNGSQQVLAVSVRKVGDAWRVLNVDSLPTAQGAR